MMAYHAKGFCCMACDQNTLALCEQMANQVSNGVRFSSPRGALHQNASVFLELLADSDLLRVGRFAKQHLAIRWCGPDPRRIRVFQIRIGQLLANNVQEGPGQIFPRTEIRENTFDRGGEPKCPPAQK